MSKYREILLTRGKVALVDDEDYDELSKYKWQASLQNGGIRATRSDENRRAVVMHRQIMKTPKNLIVDHLNDNLLDNRKENLVNCTLAYKKYRQRQTANSHKTYRAIVRIKDKILLDIKIKKLTVFGDKFSIKIPLNHGKFAIIDARNYSRVIQFHWYASKSPWTWYACATFTDPITNKRQEIRMHRLILGDCDGFDVDHKDCNGLNNLESNLRKCTNSQNQMNKRLAKHNTSGFKGVSWHKRDKMWYAYITINKKAIHLGKFKDLKDAAQAYNDRAKIEFGEFARLNLIE